MKKYIAYQLRSTKKVVFFTAIILILVCFLAAASFQPLGEGKDAILKNFYDNNTTLASILGIKFYLNPMDYLNSMFFAALLPLIFLFHNYAFLKKLHIRLKRSDEINWFWHSPLKKSKFFEADIFLASIWIMALHLLVFAVNLFAMLLFESWRVSLEKLFLVCVSSASVHVLVFSILCLVSYAQKDALHAFLPLLINAFFIAAMMLQRIIESVEIVRYIFPYGMYRPDVWIRDVYSALTSAVYCLAVLVIVYTTGRLIFRR